MLFLHETHKVKGKYEDEFEAAFRDFWMPELAKGNDARLLYFAHQAHGSGMSYQVVTLTAIRDGAAWEKLALRIQMGKVGNVVATGQNVIPKKATNLGFRFDYSTVEAALAEIFASVKAQKAAA